MRFHPFEITRKRGQAAPQLKGNEYGGLQQRVTRACVRPYEYVWFAGQPLAQTDVASGAVRYYFNDHLGTPILHVENTSSVV